MSENTSTLVIITASVREGRFGPVVTDWVAARAREHGGFDVRVVDLAGVDLPLALPDASPKAPGYPRPEGMRAVTELLDEADAFVVVTPEYNHSYPAPLKTMIDWHGPHWQAKPVAFVSYGGLSGGLRAVEHLRGVFAETHSVTLRDTVSFHGAWARFGPDGQPLDAEGCRAAAKTVLDQLAWWGWALRNARIARPYAS